MRFHLIRIIFTSMQIMLISNKKYAHSKNELISSWIDDLTLNLTLSNFLQRWSSKSYVNCGLFVFSLTIQNFIAVSTFNVEITFSTTFLSSSFRCLSSFSFSCTHYDIYNFDNNLVKHLRTSHWSFITRQRMNSLKETLETLSEKFFTNLHACLLVIKEFNLRQKIHATNTRYNQNHVQRMHNQNTRRRSFDWKKRSNVTISTLNFLSTWHRFIDFIDSLNR